MYFLDENNKYIGKYNILSCVIHGFKVRLGGLFNIRKSQLQIISKINFLGFILMYWVLDLIPDGIFKNQENMVILEFIQKAEM